MKNFVLILTAFLFINILNAQKHIATAIPAKKLTGYSEKFSTQGILAACDTLKIDSARNYWSPFYYADGDQGYVLGVSNNIDEDNIGFNVLEDANYYDVSGSDYNYITGGLIDFSIANSNNAADLNKNLVLKVYNDAGGAPGNLLASTNVSLGDVKTAVDNKSFYKFRFLSPVQIPAGKIFYISIDHSNFVWNDAVKDSIAITGDSTDQAPAAAYQYITQYTVDGSGSSWFKTSDNWYADTLLDPLDVNLYIFPYVSNAIGGCATLPVSLLNFKGSLINSQAELTWNTATEFNNKGFEVERSNDGKLFANIGFVKGAGTTSALKKYTYTDATLSDINNTFYYRLKQIDVDGKTSYSKIILLSSKSIADWKVYPNPVHDKINIQLNLTTNTKINVQIISKDGKLLMNEDKGTLAQGHQQLTLNLQNLAAGSYFVRVKAGSDVYMQGVIRQ